MKKKIFLIALLMSFGSVYALSSSFKFDISKLSFTSGSKSDSVSNNFEQDYNLSYSVVDDKDGVVEEIKTLTKKTTYLLFGNFSNEEETVEEYYKRKKDWYDLRYNPSVPKDDSNILGLDTSSQEYTDDLISGMAIPQIFNQVEELGVKYNSYGDIRVTFNGNIIISSITLPNVKIKSQSKSDPMEYDYVDSNIVMHYYYKKLNDEWKLYYLYGENTDDISNYLDDIENDSSSMSVAPVYQSELSNIYSFDKINNMSLDQINNIYNSNVDNIVFFNCFYSNRVVDSANGFFIGDGIVVTTWDFLEYSLINGQYITVRNSTEIFDIDGIVTINPEANIAIIKLKNKNNSFVKIGDYKSSVVEDPAIIISSKYGTGTVIQKGIVISNDQYIQTSIPLLDVDSGSPLFNSKGEVIGMNFIDSVNSSTSMAINSDILKEAQSKFNSISFDNIKAISFDELKEKFYYTKFGDENVINSIPKSKWNVYSKIGNIEDSINLELVKASYKDGIVSLRYKNNISSFMKSMQFAVGFKENLINDGYREVISNSSKSVYTNDKYKVVIMDEFDYFIVVMVKL